MSTETVSLPRRVGRLLILKGEDWLFLAILAVLFVLGLMGAFTHMHDWTIGSIDAALIEAAKGTGRTVHETPDWFGWTNAVTSEITPTAALLLIRKRQRQGRSITGPAFFFAASLALSLLAQLSATGIVVPYAAQMLVCLPVVSLTILAVFKFSDMSYAREAAEQEAADAERKAKQARRSAELAAERAAELERRQAEQAAELAAEQRRRDAEQAAELDRQRRQHEADLAERQARIEAEAQTRRLEIEAADRAAERERQDRREAREAELRRAAEVERARVEAEAAAELQRAEAARVEAVAEAQRQAAARLAELQAQRQPAQRGGADDDGDTAGSRRMSKAERDELTAATLALLPAGTTRDTAVAAVAEALDVSRRYARSLVPPDWTAASSSVAGGVVPAVGPQDGGEEVPQRRHLSVAAAS